VASIVASQTGSVVANVEEGIPSELVQWAAT